MPDAAVPDSSVVIIRNAAPAKEINNLDYITSCFLNKRVGHIQLLMGDIDSVFTEHDCKKSVALWITYDNSVTYHEICYMLMDTPMHEQNIHWEEQYSSKPYANDIKRLIDAKLRAVVPMPVTPDDLI